MSSDSSGSSGLGLSGSFSGNAGVTETGDFGYSEFVYVVTYYAEFHRAHHAGRVVVVVTVVIEVVAIVAGTPISRRCSTGRL